MSSRSSYDLKLDRAEHHLLHLEAEIKRYTDGKPYTIRERMKKDGSGVVRWFEFTEQPSDKIALIAGDFLYNVRASIDHIAGTLVPATRRGHANFPILWRGVWEQGPEGEDKQLARDRRRWIECIDGMPDRAIAIIKANQAPYVAPNEHNSHGLAVLNSLRNRDAHAKLIVVSSGLLAPRFKATMADGRVGELIDSTFRPDREALPHGATMGGGPDGVVHMEVVGTVEVMIRAGPQPGGYSIRETFRPLLLDGTRTLINQLREFDRTR